MWIRDVRHWDVNIRHSSQIRHFGVFAFLVVQCYKYFPSDSSFVDWVSIL
eukprot:TRINITY_DN12816_c0_g1_i1.p1 TRINITY_DN12816_c0_g1~~TRINITY_DN12816_c0_g1_i1.p1  ORF type:complete len:50 (+),score=5.73 TRINITY_DN12816_c0_g1_i1:210-359(+)